jgi:disulfide bond formation protein DsbB
MGLRRLQFWLLHVYLLGMIGMLLGGFWMQFAQGELPCPLCVAQRMALSLAAIGPAWIIVQCRFGHRDGASMLVRGMAVSALGAIGGLVLASRHILLHILPGDTGYGLPVLGLSLYTWVAVACMVILLITSITMLFHDRLEPPMVERLKPVSIASLWLFIAVLGVNAVSVFAEAGFNLFLPDDPTGYQLFGA